MANQHNSSTKLPTLVIIEQHLSIYGPFLLTTLGIIGNILSVLIFLSPRYRRQSSHFYLVSLAMSDLCFLYINLIEDTFRNHNELYQSHINVLDYSSSIVCISVQYARNTTRLLSSWIVVSFTIERLIVVYHPLRRAVICRRKIARGVVLLLFIFSLAINVNVPFHYGIIDVSNEGDGSETICDILPKYRSIYMRFAISTMITVYLVPMCIIGFVNMLICSKLWRKSLLTEKDGHETEAQQQQVMKSCRRPTRSFDVSSCLHSSKSTPSSLRRIGQRQRTQSSLYDKRETLGPLIPLEMGNSHMNNCLEDSKTGNHTRSHSFSSTPVKRSSQAKCSTSTVKTYVQSRANRVTITLLLVSCSFLLLNSPYCAAWIANYVHGFRNATLKSIKEITELFMLTNFCINFLLYCVSGKSFRIELMYILRCRWKTLYNKNEREPFGTNKTRLAENMLLKESKTRPRSTQCASQNMHCHSSNNVNYSFGRGKTIEKISAS